MHDLGAEGPGQFSMWAGCRGPRSTARAGRVRRWAQRGGRRTQNLKGGMGLPRGLAAGIINLNPLGQCLCAWTCSVVSDFATPWTVARQVPLSMEFSRQESWSGLPFPTQGGLFDSEIKPRSLVPPALAGGFFTTEPLGSSNFTVHSELLKSACHTCVYIHAC